MQLLFPDNFLASLQPLRKAVWVFKKQYSEICWQHSFYRESDSICFVNMCGQFWQALAEHNYDLLCSYFENPRLWDSCLHPTYKRAGDKFDLYKRAGDKFDLSKRAGD